MSDNNIQLDELFALPINTYKAANIGGTYLYSSDSLKRKYVDAMKKYDRTKGIGNKIEKLVEKKVITPCWLSSGIFRLLKHKMVSGDNKSIMGFYSPKIHKIYLLMDNNISFGYAANSKLAQLTIHEGLHMAAMDMKMAFLSHFKDEYYRYYTALYGDYFKLHYKANYKKEVEKICYFLFKESEFKPNGSVMGFLKKYYSLLNDSFRKYVDKESGINFDQRLRDLITICTVYLKGDMPQLIKVIPNYKHVFRSLYTAYEISFGVKASIIESFCFQELMYPSEVICIYSEYTRKQTKIHAALKQIKN